MGYEEKKETEGEYDLEPESVTMDDIENAEIDGGI